MIGGAMSFEQENRQALIDYFKGGAKGDASRKALGVEVEHFVVHAEDLREVPYAADDGGFCVREVLEYLRRFYPRETYTRQGDLIGLDSPEASITLEPAAQIEISIAPYSSIATIMEVYGRFRERIDGFLAEHGCKLVNCGYQPRQKALDLALIPKQRYRYMNEYFAGIGTHGERMMRASCSTQVSVDYRDEADAVRKLRVAQALAVVLASIAENATVFEGEPTTARLVRLNLWRDVDDDRCGSIPGLFKEGYGFEDYVDWVLSTCPIFITRPAADDPDGVPTRSMIGRTAQEAYADAPMSKDDVEHLLSMFWPDVRLKRFVEIRPGDSLPAPAIAGYTALVKGIFYDEGSLAAVEEKLGVKDGVWPLTDASTNEALAAVRRDGDAAVIYGDSLVGWQDFLLDAARRALPFDERPYLDALVERLARRRGE